MKCFLHIGTEKTGTTALQNFCDSNRDVLLTNGIYYTESAGKTNNIGLALSAYNAKRRDEYTIKHGVRSDRELLDLQRVILANLREEIEEKAKSSADLRIVFSSEHLQSRLTTIDELKGLRANIYSLAVSEITVIVYLRNPADLANSLYSTAVKSGSCLEAPPPPDHPYFNNVCNHRNTLEKFTTVFGESLVIPRIFEKGELRNGSIIDDFLEIVGGFGSADYRPFGTANESLSALGISILRRVNKKIPNVTESGVNPIRANLVTFFEKHFSNSSYVMPDGLYELYDKAFQDSNEWVRETYFPHKETLFDPQRRHKPDKAELTSDELANIADFIADVWTNKQQRIIQLSEK